MKGIIEQIEELATYHNLSNEEKVEAIKEVIKDLKKKKQEKNHKHDIVVVLDHSYEIGYILPSRSPKPDEDESEHYENILREHNQKPSECSWMVVKGSDFCIHNKSAYELEVYETEQDEE
jgi:hypothetical protein